LYYNCKLNNYNLMRSSLDNYNNKLYNRFSCIYYWCIAYYILKRKNTYCRIYDLWFVCDKIAFKEINFCKYSIREFFYMLSADTSLIYSVYINEIIYTNTYNFFYFFRIYKTLVVGKEYLKSLEYVYFTQKCRINIISAHN